MYDPSSGVSQPTNATCCPVLLSPQQTLASMEPPEQAGPPVKGASSSSGPDVEWWRKTAVEVRLPLPPV
jgi:hypothetical protein